jgi:hypothetical protein
VPLVKLTVDDIAEVGVTGVLHRALHARVL